MVQRVGAQFVVKKISDYVMAPPADPAAAEAEPDAQPRAGVPAASAPRGSLDGQTITDESGQALGTARHVAQVAVYLITDQRRDLPAQLEQAVADPESRSFFIHDERGELTAVVYQPDPSKRPVRPAATRADDI